MSHTLFSHFGIPDVLVSDNGLCRNVSGQKQHQTRHFHSISSGLAECAVQRKVKRRKELGTMASRITRLIKLLLRVPLVLSCCREMHMNLHVCLCSSQVWLNGKSSINCNRSCLWLFGSLDIFLKQWNWTLVMDRNGCQQEINGPVSFLQDSCLIRHHYSLLPRLLGGSPYELGYEANVTRPTWDAIFQWWSWKAMTFQRSLLTWSQLFNSWLTKLYRDTHS